MDMDWESNWELGCVVFSVSYIFAVHFITHDLQFNYPAPTSICLSDRAFSQSEIGFAQELLLLRAGAPPPQPLPVESP